MTEGDTAAVVTVLKLLARCIVAEQRAGEASFVDQSGSPLGARRHIAAVKRLHAAGDPGAAVVGRRFLLSPAALTRELALLSARKPVKTAAKKPAAPDLVAALREKHGFQLVKQGAA